MQQKQKELLQLVLAVSMSITWAINQYQAVTQLDWHAPYTGEAVRMAGVFFPPITLVSVFCTFE